MRELSNKKATVTIPVGDGAASPYLIFNKYLEYVLRPWLHENVGLQGIDWDWGIHMNKDGILSFKYLDVSFVDDDIALMFKLLFSEIQYG